MLKHHDKSESFMQKDKSALWITNWVILARTVTASNLGPIYLGLDNFPRDPYKLLKVSALFSQRARPFALKTFWD